MVHEGDHPVGGHGRSMESSSCKEGGDVERHAALGGVQHEQLGPDQPQQGNLVRHLQLREARDVASPLHGAEEEPRSKLTHAVDASKIGRLLSVGRVPSGRARLCPDQQGDVGGEVGCGRGRGGREGGGGAAVLGGEVEAKHGGARGRGTSLLHSWGGGSFTISSYNSDSESILVTIKLLDDQSCYLLKLAITHSDAQSKDCNRLHGKHFN